MWSGAFWNLNERERREKKIEEEALQRELVKLAKQVEAEKALAEMRETGANTRAEKGEAGANSRLDRELTAREKAAQAQRDAALTQYILERQANMEELGMKYDAEGNLLRTKAELENPFKTLQTSTDARNALAAALSSIAQFEDKVGPVNPELYQSLTGVRSGAATEPVAGPTKSGRIKLSTPGTATSPTKPGETPRTTDNAAPNLPVQVAPKPPTADIKLDSASSLGTGLLNNIRGNTWGVGPDSKNMQTLVEAYLQKSNPAEPPSILDALGKELGYDQRRPAIKK